MNTDQLERNVMDSFRLVKSDVIKLQNLVAMLSQNQEQLVHTLSDTREKENTLYHGLRELKSNLARPNVKVIALASHKTKKRWVASRKSLTFHDVNCVFAKNIKPKSKVVFKTKNKALNLGYKPCECIKRI